MFRTVLVANRGEIALRVIRTLRELEIRSVAVHSDADSDAPHIAAADVAVAIGPAPARESYLNVDRLLAAARQTGADAVHPGYGFLSESPEFARRCAAAGLVFVGPSPEALEAAGDKAGARRTAREAGVPIVPGSEPSADPATLAREARRLPFPLLIKAAAGGGGKGMRRVRSPEGLEEALRSAARETVAAFGDGRLLVERYVHPARHVEVQVLGDGRGAVAALGERECSLQRRHQKIVEEAPSTAVDGALRERLLDAARRVASAVRYAGAGTVEFLLAADGEFYFLEMNARLQVEHPVTEMVTGLDLVRLQLEIAAGELTDLGGLERPARGHAIEARLYAEDPASGFLPTTGRVLHLRWPQGPGVRVDAGIERGEVIEPHYDPLLAKVVAWGPDREQARSRIVRALEETALLGLRTNHEFLLRLLASEGFGSARTFTHSVEDAPEELGLGPAPDDGRLPPEVVAVAALALSGSSAVRARAPGGPDDLPSFGADRAGTGTEAGSSPWRSLGHWRLGDISR